MAPAGGGGSDANNGLSSGAPFLTPNHALNCGADKISAAAGTYAGTSFGSGNWGTVTCAAGNNIVPIICATFDACKITVSSAFGMSISKSFFGVFGFEVAETGNNGLCFAVLPVGSSIHHVIVGNSVCNGGANGFAASSASSTVSFDYVGFIGDLAWNATQSTLLGNSGFTMYEPIKSDSLPGTHNYIGYGGSWDNLSTTFAFDGNGVVLDDFGNGQSGGAAYDQQTLVEHMISVWNGGYGIATTGNGSSLARMVFRQNTSVHNLTDGTTSTTTCGDMTLLVTSFAEMYGNLIQTLGATACNGPTTAYGIAVNAADATDHVYKNYIYSAAGNNTVIVSSSGFSYGPSNVTGTDPAFANPVDPGQPNCTGKINVPDCMSTVIANYTPATAAAKAYGRQVPVNTGTQAYDPLIPQWFCNVETSYPGLLSGIMHLPCVTPGQFKSALPPTDLKASITFLEGIRHIGENNV